MKKAAVIYWSRTGNTRTMAMEIAAGMMKKGISVEVLDTGKLLEPDVNKIDIDEFSAVAFGCPPVGVEELEPDRFFPVFEKCRSGLSGKRILLFGSYGWGDGEWMRRWEEQCCEAGAVLVCESLICNEMPDEETKQMCRLLGERLLTQHIH